MIPLAISFAFGCIGIALALNLWRLFHGPHATDRILAMDTMTINAIAMIVLFGLLEGSATYFEAALMLAMVGFIATVAFCKFLLRGDIVE